MRPIFTAWRMAACIAGYSGFPKFRQRAVPVSIVAELVDEGVPVLPLLLSSSIRIKESHEACRPLVHLLPHHILTREYLGLFASLRVETPAGRYQ